MQQFKNTLESTLPVLFGYLPMGMAFGVLFVEQGYHWLFAYLMGLCVFAGAAQFMVIGLLAAGTDLLQIALLTFIINIRHMFFGLSFLRQYSELGWKKYYLIFGLTDETYALLTSQKKDLSPNDPQEFFYITFANHMYWATGCLLGGILGSVFTFDSTGMEFTLTALFIVLLIENLKAAQKYMPYLLGLVCALISILIFGKENMLLPAIIFSTVILYVYYEARKNA